MSFSWLISLAMQLVVPPNQGLFQMFVVVYEWQCVSMSGSHECSYVLRLLRGLEG